MQNALFIERMRRKHQGRTRKACLDDLYWEDDLRE
jgi:hypothetical protein